MKRHIILTHGRSGSNFVANSLNLHPQVVNYGEVFGHWTVPSKLNKFGKLFGRTDSQFLDYLYRSSTVYYFAQFWSALSHMRAGKPINFKRRSTITTLGVKEFGMHFDRLGLDDYLAQNPDISVIYLYRENSLQRYLSVLSLNRNRVIATEGDVSIPKLTIDVAEMMTSIEVLEQELAYTHKLVRSLTQNPVLEIKYEEAFAGPESLQAMVKDVCEFLQIDPINQTSKQKKILSSSFQEVIENYGDFVAALKASPYAHWLEAGL
ncbi:hypothetical protein [Halioxenophilus sp. WMMB6]|uniref:hypothetical protein n=1 Tax=Halioxenophilus sp. WMMB6 TaxID=3073815 RepID=UPI00295F1E82|nr:hypothetical protein [Halioxenophilus sp. WMMB6]